MSDKPEVILLTDLQLLRQIHEYACLRVKEIVAEFEVKRLASEEVECKNQRST